MCNDYALAATDYQAAWAGVRFARPFFEKTSLSNTQLAGPQVPFFVKQDMVEEQQDSSFMNFVQIIGAGRLHGQRAPAVQLIHR